MSDTAHDALGGIAVVGLAGRFPRAGNIEQFWHNLRNGIEGISFFSDEELIASGVDPAVFNNPAYVRAGGMLDDMDKFDAGFFDYTPREAEAMDPQQRVFLETAWAALENAGYDAQKYEGAIGVYAGISMNAYLYHNLFSNPAFVESIGGFQLMISNDKDFVGTNVSYKFNLKGPSMTVQTACSTSLVAICQACQSLLNYQSDMTLVGGVSIGLVKKVGYIYQSGGIASPDGHCRTFDAKAKGTVPGNGVGVVVLKRLSEAVADGDNIYAVIKGSALNNDGSMKVGFTAPSVDGQAEVIAMAQAIAGIEADTIDYIEAHGTATELGDPIEVAALTKAFRMTTEKTGYCAIGSVKSSIGHLDAAAGVAGFIKTVLSLAHKEIPPSLHFEKPNPTIDFASSPFVVNAKLREWERKGHPRRAGVSAFGIGGTNAHVVLEEAPETEPSGPSRPRQLLMLSAKTETALETMTSNLEAHLRNNESINLADVAYTLQMGRKSFNHRRILVADSVADAIATLENRDPRRMFSAKHDSGHRAVAFMFPGQGAQHANMGRELYETEPAFRQIVDDCATMLKPHLDFDLRDVLFPEDSKVDEANERLKQTAVTQPAVFVMEYALAKLWMSLGIEPQAMIGHSIGEYVAACLADVFSLEDALALVAARGRLMQQLPAGAMLAVSLSETELDPLLEGALCLAAVNAPKLCVVSGPTPEIEAFEKKLAKKKVDCRLLRTSHAFHSVMMDDILAPFQKLVEDVQRSAPTRPYISNVTGGWVSAEQATDPGYWARHLRNAVRFNAGVKALLQEPSRVLLEVGPGRSLGALSGMTLAEMSASDPQSVSDQVIVSSMRHPEDHTPDMRHFLAALGKLWMAGIEPKWSVFYENENRRRAPLPSYPFEWQRYWVEAGESVEPSAQPAAVSFGKKTDVKDWFYAPVWKQSHLARAFRGADIEEKQNWLVFHDGQVFAESFVERLRELKQEVFVVRAGEKFSAARDSYTVAPGNPADYDELVRELRTQDKLPQRVIHLWGITEAGGVSLEFANLADTQNKGFYSGLFLVQALGNQGITDSLQFTVVTNDLHEVTGGETVCPEKATLLGACTVIPQEYLNMTCRTIDIVLPDAGAKATLLDDIIRDITSDSPETVVAYRGRSRWIREFEPIEIDPVAGDLTPSLREGGTYLITGGLGRIGLAMAGYLAQAAKAKLVLLSRRGLPPREEWAQWLEAHDAADGTSVKIRKIQALEKVGAEVMVAAADAADLEQMRQVFQQADERFGGVNGIVHAAGVLEGESFGSILETSREDCQGQFRPKVDGLLVLRELLSGRQVDFCFLLSSLSAVLGGLGFVAYAAANSFMDAFASRQNQDGGAPWISVNWDAWDFTENTNTAAAPGAALADLALKPDEGVEAFKRLLSLDSPKQFVVSTGDLRTRINKWIQLESVRGADAKKSGGGKSRHKRPTLATEYAAPTNEIEQTLSEIWQDLFGMEEIGVHDNFFELGGHSLLATGLISRVREAFQMEVSLHSFFEKPTIADLAEVVLAKMVEQEDSDTLNELLAELEAE